MSESIKISIIIPVYNAEKYIERCIKSLIKQTYKNIEIVLVNDGSIDSSLDILNKYSQMDTRFTVISQENKGPSVARNIGIDNSNGDYIAFIDADDYVEFNYIEKMVKNTKNLKADMVVSNYLEVRKEGNIKSHVFTFIEEYELYTMDEKCLGETLCGRGGLVWGKLFRTSIVKKNNLSFNKNIYMCEDLLFCLEFIKYVNFITKVNDYIYIHNKYNDESITAKYNENLFVEQINVQVFMEEFVINNNLYNKYTENVLFERLKGIMWFSIYKEIINITSTSIKLNNIKAIIENEIIVANIDKFNQNGPIDKAILSAIKNKNNFMVYILSYLRVRISNIRLKISSINVNIRSFKDWR